MGKNKKNNKNKTANTLVDAAKMDVKMDPFTKLPDEIMTHIFKCLTWTILQKKCALVSKKWFEFIRNNAELSNKLRISERTSQNENITF